MFQNQSHYVFEPALDDWRKDLGMHSITPTRFSGDAARLINASNWHLFEIKGPQQADMIFGIAGDAQAATFIRNSEGLLDFGQRTTNLKTGTNLKVWLNSLLAKDNSN